MSLVELDPATDVMESDDCPPSDATCMVLQVRSACSCSGLLFCCGLSQPLAYLPVYTCTGCSLVSLSAMSSTGIACYSRAQALITDAFVSVPIYVCAFKEYGNSFWVYLQVLHFRLR